MPASSRNPRILVVLAHPRGGESLCGALATAYAEGARARGGAKLRLIDLSSARFDRDVRTASPRDQPLEPDLLALRRAMEWANHLVFVFPTWWGTMPGLLKSALDRILVPGWAFRITEGGTGYAGCLQGRSAEIVTTMDTPAAVYRLVYGAPGYRALGRATLAFCGIELARITRFGPVRTSTLREREGWLAGARTLGALAAAGRTQTRQRWWRVTFAWLRALRLQFYPMTFLAYWAGALAAGRPLDAQAFVLGGAVLFSVEAATVLSNELVDEPSDRRNRYYSAFNGGSRVLIERLLSRKALQNAAVGASAAATVLLALLGALESASYLTVTVMGATSVLAVGYTLPPLRLCYRGLGELTVALTHSFGAVYAGYLLQGGDIAAKAPLALSACLAAAIVPAILLAGVPDAEADRATGKRTAAVLLGVRHTCALAAGFVLLSAALPALFALDGVRELELLAWVAPVHGCVVLSMFRKRWSRLDRPQRVDPLLAAALSYILWFALLPLARLGG